MDRNAETQTRAIEVKRLLLYVLAPLSVVLVVALGAAYAADIAITDLLRDPSAVLDGPWYVGVFSTTGIALWASGAAVCLLSLSAKPQGAARALLIAGAVVSLILGVDDAFLLHETIKNEIGIPSPVTIGVYGVIAIVLIRPAWRYLVGRPDALILFLAVGLLAVSVILDAAGEAGLPTPPFSAIIEDMAKFLGIATWTAYLAGVARDVIKGATREPTDGT